MELEASVDAYLKMLDLEQSGQTFKKSVENRLLREGALSKRSAASVEYRMQNISAVLEQLGLRRITGYMPAKNIGAGISKRIQEVLAAKNVFAPSSHASTDDQAAPVRQAPESQKQKFEDVPEGVWNPQQNNSSVSSFLRASIVRNWVVEQANGTCEGCGQPAPFNLPNGSPFLEAHHVKHLANLGSDRPSNAVALCPNCHRRCHLSSDKDEFTLSLYKRVARLVKEP